MPKHLMVVDDAPFIRRVIADIAVEAGWSVVAEASDGEAAISLYNVHKPDLVTLDWHIPKLGGLEVLKSILAHHAEAKVVVVSSIEVKETIAQAIRSGAIDFVTKPFERDRLLAVFAKAST